MLWQWQSAKCWIGAPPSHRAHLLPDGCLSKMPSESITSLRRRELAQTIFWICLALILYHHVIYPLLLPLLARLRKPTPVDSETRQGAAEQPSITIIIPCHNEAEVIARKIENLVALDYPRNRLSI